MKKTQTIYKNHGKFWCILFASMVFVQALSAQTRTITGVVTDDRRETLPGVSIIIEGTTTGAITDINGRYSIAVPATGDVVLLFSFMGMQTSRVPVGPGATVDVVLREEMERLEEVVITGFRTVSAEAYVGSAFVMSDATIRQRPFGSVDEALRGNAPGLISTSSGQPGQAAEIRLRGVGSMNAGNQPLFVVDGVVWDMDGMTGDAGSPANPLTTLNPMDIANITILRDAASAALYGSRGANGVIVITTHSGLAGDRPSFSFMTQAGVGIMHMRPNLLNGPQFAELWVEAEMHGILAGIIGDRVELAEQLWGLYLDQDNYLFNGLNFHQWQKQARHSFNNMFAIPVGDGTYHDFDFFGEHRHLLPNTNWFDEITRIAPFVQTDFSMRGGTRDLRYFLSLGYFNQQGTIIHSQLQRYSLRLRLSGGTDRNRIQWNLNNALTYSMQSGPPLSGANFNQPQYTASIVPPVVPVHLQDGSLNFNFPDNLLFSNNPVASANLNRNDRPQTRIFMQGYLQVNNILPGLRFRTTNTMNYTLSRRTDFAHSDFGVGSAVGGRLLQRDAHNRRFTTTNLFFYDYNWGGVHRLNAVAGAEFENRNRTFNQFITGNFPTNDHHHASMGSEILDWTGGGDSYSQIGLIATVDYSFRFRYFLTASIRRDGSSRFHPDYRWGDFWALAGAWRISNEPWFRNIVPFEQINSIRLRMSYGTSGTLPSELFSWREAFSLNTYMGQTGARQTFIPSPTLTWEGNRIWNFGIDMRLFNERIRFSAEYFDRRSHNLLRDVPVSSASGFQTQLMNTSAGIHNTGFEFELGGTAFERGRHSLDFNFNLATLRAVYYGLESPEWDPTMRQWLDNGLSVNSWRLRRWGGVDPQTGQRLMWREFPTNSGIFDWGPNNHSQAPWLLEGQGIPKVTGGLSLTYSWGPLSLSALFSYGWGHHIFDFLGASRTDTEGVFNNYSMSVDQLDRWTPLNPYGQVPMRLHGASPQTRHTRFLYRGDYLKIQSIRLQYTLPESLINRIGMQSAIIFAQTENPFIFSHIPGYDPELSIDGFRMLDSFPSATTFLVGLSLNF
ncbi:MAG: SusC/RagA family TonB-linked outer membrane protein [Bacteroidales bacterium]|nr:SusC/RagA family TonB-linked outer membrane protein [Bacteroidales bacterium]